MIHNYTFDQSDEFSRNPANSIHWPRELQLHKVGLSYPNVVNHFLAEIECLVAERVAEVLKGDIHLQYLVLHVETTYIRTHIRTVSLLVLLFC